MTDTPNNCTEALEEDLDEHVTEEFIQEITALSHKVSDVLEGQPLAVATGALATQVVDLVRNGADFEGFVDILRAHPYIQRAGRGRHDN